MYKNILLPTDGSALAEKAVKAGIVFASEIHAKATVLTVTEPFHVFTFSTRSVEGTPEEYRQQTHKLAQETLDAAANEAKAVGVACETIEVENEHPYQAIVDIAKDRGCDLIMMASHNRQGLSAIVRGSETARVLAHTDVPVLVSH